MIFIKLFKLIVIQSFIFDLFLSQDTLTLKESETDKDFFVVFSATLCGSEAYSLNCGCKCTEAKFMIFKFHENICHIWVIPKFEISSRKVVAIIKVDFQAVSGFDVVAQLCLDYLIARLDFVGPRQFCFFERI